MTQSDYGKVEFEGKTYVLQQDAYICGDVNDRTAYYEASAICEEDGEEYMVYMVYWDILESTYEYWADGGDDEGDACDWGHPASVKQLY